MDNKEFYRNTFDQIHVSEDMLVKIKTMKKNKSYIRGRLQMKYAIAAIIIFVFIGTNAVCYAATGNDFYTFVVNSSIIQNFFGSDSESKAADQIENSVNYVADQSVVYGEYLFTLYRYYSENNSGIILAEFLVTDLNGEQLSEEERKNLEAESETGIDNGFNHFSITINEINGSLQSKLYQDDEGNAIYALYCMVALLGSEDTQVNTDNIDKISELIFQKIDRGGKVTEIGTFEVPANPVKIDSITFDVSDNPKAIYAVASGIGMQLVFDINVAKAELERELEASGVKDDPAYDEEAYGYSLYKDLSIHKKDGTEYKLVENGSRYMKEDSIISHDSGHPYEYSTGLEVGIFAFSKIIDVNQIDYLEIDGNHYKVQ